MIQARPAAVAGRFYPAGAAKLAATVQRYLAEAGATVAAPPPKAMIVPHAGYIYSGPVAASAYARLAPGREMITRVVLIGPAHYVPIRGLAVSGADAFATPLGVVPVDGAAVDGLRDLPQVTVRDDAHEREHCLEVQLPFLQAVLRDFTIVPLLAGAATYEEVRAVIERLWGGAETLVVISSDLSHYYDYAMAQRLDAATAAAILALDPASIGEEQACGRIPIGGLLLTARAKGLHAVAGDLRNSGDTAGRRSEVVGYGSFLFA
jgi:AmmeMemoRadiSam system protein B